MPTFAKDDFDQDVHPEDSTTTELKNDLDDFLRTTQTKVRNLALNNITIPTVTLASSKYCITKLSR